MTTNPGGLDIGNALALENDCYAYQTLALDAGNYAVSFLSHAGYDTGTITVNLFSGTGTGGTLVATQDFGVSSVNRTVYQIGEVLPKWRDCGDGAWCQVCW